jgi:hypothetical protein
MWIGMISVYYTYERYFRCPSLGQNQNPAGQAASTISTASVLSLPSLVSFHVKMSKEAAGIWRSRQSSPPPTVKAPLDSVVAGASEAVADL